MYYNQITKEKKTRQDLKKLMNCSIPVGQETVEDWLLIHEETPERQENKMIVKDDIEVRDGIAWQTYKYTDFVDEVDDESDRISVLENAVMDLAKIISDLEYQRVYLENSAAESNPLND